MPVSSLEGASVRHANMSKNGCALPTRSTLYSWMKPGRYIMPTFLQESHPSILIRRSFFLLILWQSSRLLFHACWSRLELWQWFTDLCVAWPNSELIVSVMYFEHNGRADVALIHINPLTATCTTAIVQVRASKLPDPLPKWLSFNSKTNLEVYASSTRGYIMGVKNRSQLDACATWLINWHDQPHPLSLCYFAG